MKKAAACVYILIVLVLATSSALVSWASDEVLVFAIELAVNITFVAGLVLYVLGARIRWWMVPFSITVVSEAVLLIADARSGATESLIWLLILAPGFVMNASVAKIPDHFREHDRVL